MGLDKSAFISFEDLFTYFRRPSTHDGVAAHESESYFHKSQNSAPNRCLSVASSLEIVSKSFLVLIRCFIALFSCIEIDESSKNVIDVLRVLNTKFIKLILISTNY